MEQERREKLISVLKKDDAASFGEFLTPEVLSAVFGRFPLLSLLYLFDADRIAKKYSSELIKERPRIAEDRIPEADQLFASKAGKCLRYYLSAPVSPLEMLAILGRKKELERLYKTYPNAARTLPMLHKIYYTRLGTGVYAVGESLILPSEPLSFGQKRSLLFFACVFLIAFVLIAGLTTFSFVYYGVGSKAAFYQARTDGAAQNALFQDRYLSLKKDVYLASTVPSYSASFDGKGHVVRLSSPFAEKVTGEIRDVIFVLEKDFQGDAVILENQGTLKNVRVVAAELSLQKTGENMGLLTAVNSGTIEFCTAVADLVIQGEGGGDCFFAPFAGSNQGTIHDCTADVSAQTKNVDLGGIAGKNEEKGVITDCTVKCAFSEVSDIKNWTPNVAGVAVQNDGSIYRATVTGSIVSNLVAPALSKEESPASSYAAGIACVNGGSIKECENSATISSYAENGYALAGGISAINVHYVSATAILPGTVEKSVGKGEVTAHSPTDLAYAGGISAQNPQGGKISECSVFEKVTSYAALSSLEEGDSPVSSYAGGIAALNLDSIEGARVFSSVSAKAEKGYALAGGVVALNSYAIFQNVTYIGTLQSCRSDGEVFAESASYNAYAGGVAAENNQGRVISCIQSSSVAAKTAGESAAYEFIGGIVGYNNGLIYTSLFTGTLPDYDTNTFVGGICGLIRLPYSLSLNLSENSFSAEGHTSGAVLSERTYYNLIAGYIYGLEFMEKNEAYRRYIEEILDLGGAFSDPQEITTSEYYYE